jgi:hypothetical protein
MYVYYEFVTKTDDQTLVQISTLRLLRVHLLLDTGDAHGNMAAWLALNSGPRDERNVALDSRLRAIRQLEGVVPNKDRQCRLSCVLDQSPTTGWNSWRVS